MRGSEPMHPIYSARRSAGWVAWDAAVTGSPLRTPHAGPAVFDGCGPFLLVPSLDGRDSRHPAIIRFEHARLVWQTGPMVGDILWRIAFWRRAFRPLHTMSTMMWRVAVLLLVAAGATAARQPNILLIVSDDQGYMDLGSMGSRDILTDRLDRLASEGARLTSFYAAFPVCTPSRGSLLTGRYPQRNGTYDNFRNDRVDDGYRYRSREYEISPERILGMDTREVLLSQVLSSAGYATGVFGKWDLGSLRRFLPMQRGFDDFYGFVNTGIDYWTHERYGIPSMYRRNSPTVEDRGIYATDLFEREALRFIDRHRAQPFFVYLSYNAPHGASSLDRGIRGFVQAPGSCLDLYPSPDGLQEERRHKFMAAVSCMDASIGRILDRIDRHGLRDDCSIPLARPGHVQGPWFLSFDRTCLPRHRTATTADVTDL